MSEEERAKRRIKVIKDVLKRMKYLNMTLTNYLRIENKEGIKFKSCDDPAHKFISILESNCSVCAKGALFLSHIRKYNKVSVGQVLDFNYQIRKCRDLEEFDQKNLDLVEFAYQQCSFNRFDENATKAVQFGRKFSCGDKKHRLRAILRNMLKNNGVFVPPSIPVSVLN